MNYHFVDKIIDFEKNKRIKALKNISLTEEYFDDHFPRCQRVPNSILIESLATVSGLLTLASFDFKCIALLVMVKNAAFERPVFAGEQLQIVIETVSLHEKAAMFDGDIVIENEKVAQSSLTLGITFLDELSDPCMIENFSSVLKRSSDFFNHCTKPNPLFES